MGKARQATPQKGALLVLAASLWVAGLLTPASASSTSVVAGADAFVLSGSPNTNRGSASSLRIRNGIKISYLRFHVPELPPGEAVSGASLQMYALGGSKCALGAEVLRAASDSWDETSITWKNQPGAIGAALSGANWTSKGYASFDVEPAVGAAGPVSFVLRHGPGCNATADNTFNSREAASNRPLLTIETTAGPLVPACSDGADNDADGLTDFPDDPGCTDAGDDDESDVPPPAPACSDGADNDADGLTDFPDDPGCTDANDDDEGDVATERPNILIIMTDDQRASSDGLSVMDDMQTIFGGGGTYFPNGVVTTPLCCPSRASMFTGQYAHNTRVIDNNGNPLDQLTTMQYHLQQRLGYRTALAGKYLNEFTGTPPYFDLLSLRVAYGDPATRDYGTTFLSDQAVQFLNAFEQNDAQPWLLYVTPFAPHEPAVPETKYQSAPVPAWEETPARNETDLSDKPPYVVSQQASKADIQSLRTRMIRTLYSVDDLVAAVFAELETLGETDTLAFFLSDNGYQWYEHGLDKKGKPYEDSVRVPFFARWPGHVAAGAVDSKIVANIDIAPTVYQALGYTPHNYIPDGRSIFTSHRATILTEGFGRGFRSMWTPSWTYVEYEDGFREYYGPDDPWQLENAFATGSPPANAAELASLLQGYRDCVGTACP